MSNIYIQYLMGEKCLAAWRPCIHPSDWIFPDKSIESMMVEPKPEKIIRCTTLAFPSSPAEVFGFPKITYHQFAWLTGCLWVELAGPVTSKHGSTYQPVRTELQTSLKHYQPHAVWTDEHYNEWLIRWLRIVRTCSTYRRALMTNKPITCNSAPISQNKLKPYLRGSKIKSYTCNGPLHMWLISLRIT